MGAVMSRLEQQAVEAEELAARRRKLVEMVREIGEEGLTELAALIAAEAPTATNGNGNGNGAAHPPAPKRAVRSRRPKPKGREAVRRIVQQRAGIWTLTEIRAEMVERGWFTSPRAVEVATKRHAEDGHGRWISPGRYVFPADYTGEVEDEKTADDASGVMVLGE
jgi:hypothetical protein